MNSALATTLIAAGAALVVGLIGLIGVPISAQVTGAVQRGTERRKQQAAHESDALGALLRSWIVLSTNRTYEAGALCDWLTALAEMAAYGGSTAAAWLAAFIRQGADASTSEGQDLLIETVLEVRRSALPHRQFSPADRESIRALLFGAADGLPEPSNLELATEMIAHTAWALGVLKLKTQIEDLAAPLRRVQIGEVGPGVARLIADSLDEEVELLDDQEIQRLITDPGSEDEAGRWMNLATEHVETLTALNDAIRGVAA